MKPLPVKILSDELKTLIDPPKTTLQGVLGLSRTQVNVAGRPGFVWVRLLDNPNEVIRAHNSKVSPTYNMPVILSYDGIKYEVVDRDINRYSNWVTNSAFLPQHGTQHSFVKGGGGGGDIVWVDSQQFLPLLVFPSGTVGGLSVNISPMIYRNSSGTWMFIGNTGTPNINQTPSTGATIYLLMLNDQTGNFYYVTGTTFSNAITGSWDIVGKIPAPTSTVDKPIAAIRSTSGTVSWDNIYDVRQFFGGGAGGGGGGTGPQGPSGSPGSPGAAGPTGTNVMMIALSGTNVGQASRLDFLGPFSATLTGTTVIITNLATGTGGNQNYDSTYLRLDAANDPVTGQLILTSPPPNDTSTNSGTVTINTFHTGSLGVGMAINVKDAAIALGGDTTIGMSIGVSTITSASGTVDPSMVGERITLTMSNSGTSLSSDLTGLDISETANAGANLSSLVGINIGAGSSSGTTIRSLYGIRMFYGLTNTSAQVRDRIGLDINAIYGGTGTNRAIQTSSGTVFFGDDLHEKTRIGIGGLPTNLLDVFSSSGTRIASIDSFGNISGTNFPSNFDGTYLRLDTSNNPLTGQLFVKSIAPNTNTSGTAQISTYSTGSFGRGLVVNALTSPAATGTTDLKGVVINATTSSSASGTSVENIVGQEINVQKLNSGTSSDQLYGLNVNVLNNTNAPSSTMRGLGVSVTGNVSGTNNVNVYGIQISSQNFNKTNTNTLIGIDIQDVVGGTGTNMSLRTASGTVFFGDNVQAKTAIGIGGLPTPPHLLDVFSSSGTPLASIDRFGNITGTNFPQQISSSSTNISGTFPVSTTGSNPVIIDVMDYEFGSGNDGTFILLSGTYTLQKDMYYRSLTIGTGATLITNNYLVKVNGLLANGGIIQNDGKNGGDGFRGTGGIGGMNGGGAYTTNTNPTRPGNYLVNRTRYPAAPNSGNGGDAGGTGTVNGTAGGTSSPTNHPSATPLILMVGIPGSGGGAHGAVGNAGGGQSFIPPYGNAGGHGGDATGSLNNRLGGGGGGGGGGIVELWAYIFSNSGTISSKGGNGGNGEASGTAIAAGVGGGGGGGAVLIYYRNLIAAGTGSAPIVEGGGFGTIGSKINAGSGTAGLYYIQQI